MLLSEPTFYLPQKHCESESIALFLFILKTMIVHYIERALGGMRWIWLVEEGESDQYGSACSCCRSLNDAEVVTCDAGSWLHFLVSHCYSAEVPLKILSPF